MISRNITLPVSAKTETPTNLAYLALAADCGSATELVDYLLSDKPITIKDRELLAWLIARRVVKFRVRSEFLNDIDAATKCAAFLLKAAKDAGRQVGKAKPDKSASELELIDKAIELTSNEFPNVSSALTPKSVLSIRNVYSNQRVASYVHEHCLTFGGLLVFRSSPHEPL